MPHSPNLKASLLIHDSEFLCAAIVTAHAVPHRLTHRKRRAGVSEGGTIFTEPSPSGLLETLFWICCACPCSI